jgi:hypothetical protein
VLVLAKPISKKIKIEVYKAEFLNRKLASGQALLDCFEKSK